MPRGQSCREGGRASQQQQSGAGRRPGPSSGRAKEATRDHRERGEREANPPQQLGGYEGSRIPEECSASTQERSTEKQS